jgi:hypothetical protein
MLYKAIRKISIILAMTVFLIFTIGLIPSNNVKADITVTALYEISTFLVTFSA